jgi:hypothetical protein
VEPEHLSAAEDGAGELGRVCGASSSWCGIAQQQAK